MLSMAWIKCYHLPGFVAAYLTTKVTYSNLLDRQQEEKKKNPGYYGKHLKTSDLNLKSVNGFLIVGLHFA